MLLRVPFQIDLRWKESEENLRRLLAVEARTAHYRFGSNAHGYPTRNWCNLQAFLQNRPPLGDSMWTLPGYSGLISSCHGASNAAGNYGAATLIRPQHNANKQRILKLLDPEDA